MNSLSLRGGADDVAATVPRIVCSRWELGADRTDGLSHVYHTNMMMPMIMLCNFANSTNFSQIEEITTGTSYLWLSFQIYQHSKRNP